MLVRFGENFRSSVIDTSLTVVTIGSGVMLSVRLSPRLHGAQLGSMTVAAYATWTMRTRQSTSVSLFIGKFQSSNLLKHCFLLLDTFKKQLTPIPDMKKSEFELILSRLRPFASPVKHLEQYPTPASIVADIVYQAYMQGNVKGRTIADLGCGSGFFALACALLGAKKVYGVELDPQALEVARANERLLQEEFDVSVDWLESDVSGFFVPVDVVFQNPPFGIKRKGADRAFLKRSLEVSPILYSLHMEGKGTRTFINGFVQNLSARVVSTKNYDLTIPRLFESHRSDTRHITVTLYYIKRGKYEG